MKKSNILLVIFVLPVMQITSYAQQISDNKGQINAVLKTYVQSVIERDSTAFYSLFNDGPVEWAAAVKDRSQAKLNEKSPQATNYFSSSYKSFFRYLYKKQSTEDKFDNIKIIEDGTVASVTMDYSFWADGKMTNWGCKYLGLIKIDGKWKITSVIFSIELTDYFEQPPLSERVFSDSVRSKTDSLSEGRSWEKISKGIPGDGDTQYSI